MEKRVILLKNLLDQRFHRGVYDQVGNQFVWPMIDYVLSTK
jgi:hypothetical protein